MAGAAFPRDCAGLRLLRVAGNQSPRSKERGGLIDDGRSLARPLLEPGEFRWGRTLKESR